MCQQTSSKISSPAFTAGIPHAEALFASAIVTPPFATTARSAPRQGLCWRQKVFLYTVSILRCVNVCENLFHSTLTENMTEKKLLPVGAADQYSLIFS